MTQRNESVSSNSTTAFGLSKDLSAPLTIKINYLQHTKGNHNLIQLSRKLDDTLVFKKLSQIHKNSDLYITCAVFDGTNNNAVSIEVQTPYKSFGSKGRIWNSFLKLPINYNQISIDSYLRFRVYEISDTKPCLFGTSYLSLFNQKTSTLRKGSQKVPLHLGDVAAGPDTIEYNNIKGLTELETNLIKYENGEYHRIDWVDKLVLPTINKVNDVDKEHEYYLYFELPNFELPMVYSDIKYMNQSGLSLGYNDSNNITENNQSTVVINSIDIPMTKNNQFKVHDSDSQIGAFNNITQTNANLSLDPIELKYHKLERNINNNSILDKELKPSPQLRDQLVKILAKPSNVELSDVEKNLIWKYRYFFSKNSSINESANKASSSSTSTKSFLPKFLKSINWENDYELNHVFQEIIPNYWSVDRLQIGDALELLGNYFNPHTLASSMISNPSTENKDPTTNAANLNDPSTSEISKKKNTEESKFLKIFKYVTFLRKFAVDRLRLANNEELLLYLLQLVQALKYESLVYDRKVPLAQVPANFQIVNELNSDIDMLKSPLAKFLIEKSIENESLGNFFYWYLKVEGEDQLSPNTTGPPIRIYTAIMNKYIESLKKYSHAHKLPNYENLKRQTVFIRKLTKLVELIRTTFKKNEATSRKKEFLKEYLSDSSNEFLKFPAFPLPLDPSVIICGCYPEESSVFKSSLAPLKITFKTIINQKSHSSQLFAKKYNKYGKYPLMFKIGDDLRQDQLVIQIINLMDQLLKNENLDLKLTPYKILATSPIAGLIQFVPNETLDTVLATTYPTLETFTAPNAADAVGVSNNGILNYMKMHSMMGVQSAEPIARSVLQHSPESIQIEPPQQAITSDLGVSSIVMDNYVKSCAGYCVITYLLGVGDRHLDNLLLSPNGKFWHADFGYILGRDPKPFPPLMKLPIQVIDGMGGLNHENFNIFKNYCFITYTTLRKNSNLILNLFQLMLDANIPDIKIDPKRAIEKVEEKFCLEMTEEEAILHFQDLIGDSVNAFLPVVIDRLHSLAQYWRA